MVLCIRALSCRALLHLQHFSGAEACRIRRADKVSSNGERRRWGRLRDVSVNEKESVTNNDVVTLSFDA
jgi:hypothetical protein